MSGPSHVYSVHAVNPNYCLVHLDKLYFNRTQSPFDGLASLHSLYSKVVNMVFSSLEMNGVYSSLCRRSWAASELP